MFTVRTLIFLQMLQKYFCPFTTVLMCFSVIPVRTANSFWDISLSSNISANVKLGQRIIQ